MEEIRYWLEGGWGHGLPKLPRSSLESERVLCLWQGGFTCCGKPGLTCNDGAGCEENVVDWDHCGGRVEFCGLVQEPVEDGAITEAPVQQRSAIR